VWVGVDVWVGVWCVCVCIGGLCVGVYVCGVGVYCACVGGCVCVSVWCVYVCVGGCVWMCGAGLLSPILI